MPPGADSPPPAPVRTVLVQLTVGGRKLGVQVDVPTGPVAPAAMLPLYRGVAEQITALAVRAAEEAGERVSCRAGCAACCRQVVAVSTLEARELVKRVQRLPEPLRTRVRDRFAAAARRLAAEAPHLISRMLNPQDFATDAPQAADELVEFGREYLRLRIDCPFLEDERCTIYEHRPVACRQYVVVSAPEHCATLSPGVRALLPAGGAAQAWMPAWERSPATGRPVQFVALVLAPDFVAAHPDEPPPRPGVELVNEFLHRMQTHGKWENKGQGTGERP